MFRNPLSRKTDTHSSSATSTALEDRPAAKGRPTPSRRDSQAAARERAKVSRNPKAARRQRTAPTGSSSAEIRAGMKRGDERFLLPRDRGPVRRFIRDWIDSRYSFSEFLLPLLVVGMVLGYTGIPRMVTISSSVVTTTFLATIVEAAWVTYGLKRRLRERFPDESTRGTTSYALLRMIQIRFLRVPKPQVKRGQALRDRY